MSIVFVDNVDSTYTSEKRICLSVCYYDLTNGVTNSVLSYLACSFGAIQSTHSERYPLSETVVKGSFCSNTENPAWFKSDH